jgi:hypothetical protein
VLAEFLAPAIAATPAAVPHQNLVLTQQEAESNTLKESTLFLTHTVYILAATGATVVQPVDTACSAVPAPALTVNISVRCSPAGITEPEHSVSSPSRGHNSCLTNHPSCTSWYIHCRSKQPAHA